MKKWKRRLYVRRNYAAGAAAFDLLYFFGYLSLKMQQQKNDASFSGEHIFVLHAWSTSSWTFRRLRVAVEHAMVGMNVRRHLCTLG